MKLWIDSAALAGTKDHLLKPGALYALHRLNQHEYRIGYDQDALSAMQRELLSSDQLAVTIHTPEEAEATIQSTENETLKITGYGETAFEADSWLTITEKLLFPERRSTLERHTSETDIRIRLNLDGQGESRIATGLGFLDHMLEQIAKHGLLDLEVSCDGDLHVDEHHTIEDIAIGLGTAIRKALGDKTGIERYGFALPMDETTALVALDISGRPYLKFKGTFTRDMVGDMPTEMVEHFFYSLAMNLRATLHITFEGSNDHHKIEACFKGFARALRAAADRNERARNILPSTKDLL